MKIALLCSTTTTLAKLNRYSREIHEIDLQFNHVISCDIKRRFDIHATRGIPRVASRVADRSRCRMISPDRTADQSHEYLSCNDFFGQGSGYYKFLSLDVQHLHPSYAYRISNYCSEHKMAQVSKLFKAFVGANHTEQIIWKTRTGTSSYTAPKDFITKKEKISVSINILPYTTSFFCLISIPR